MHQFRAFQIFTYLKKAMAPTQNTGASAGTRLNTRARFSIITAALLALFLGAMDALIMSAAMPTIVAELGGLPLYSWVYSAYFLARAVSLPVFGKLADLYNNRNLFLIAIGIFLVGSIMAGAAGNMAFLILARVVQGIGAGGNFAMVYIVLADIAPPQNRGRTISFASSIWGIASVLGPTLGGFIVTYFSWRWIFFINVPLGVLSMTGLALYLVEIRPKKDKVRLDLAGVFTLSVAILSLLTLFLIGGRTYPWLSTPVIALLGLSLIAGFGFVIAEKRAPEPILALQFFTIRGFGVGNAAVFLSSFAIFSYFAYAPLFIQGAMGKTPVQVGLAMLSLSLGWSLGSLFLGQVLNRLGQRPAAIFGSLCLVAGCAATLFFDTHTRMSTCFVVFLVIGIGMGFVTLATLLVVQNSLDLADLGVATTSHQFARTLGGTVGIGICGGFVTTKMASIADFLNKGGAGTGPALNPPADSRLTIENLLQPEIQAQLPADLQQRLQAAVADGVSLVFWTLLAAALLCVVLCILLPGRDYSEPKHTNESG
jgi:EmrB/QacA subfamily drug resistance transporter